MGTIHCPKCDELVDSEPRFCPRCGLDREQPSRPGTDTDKTGLRPAEPPDQPAQLGQPEDKPTVVLFGRFEVQAELGRGGMGIVYRCFDRRLNTVKAVKLLQPSLAADPEALARLSQEVSVAQRDLFHANIIRVHDIHIDPRDSSPRNIGFSMELLHGATLAQHVSGGVPLSPLAQPPSLYRLAFVSSVFRPLAAAIDYVHAKGLVHRDVKPSNIMICGDVREPTVKLLDFGIVRVGEDSELTDIHQPGAPVYMAPELTDTPPSPATSASDIYSLGKVVYLALTGRRLANPADYDAPSDLVEYLPRSLDAVLHRCFLKAEKRPRSAAELADALEEVEREAREEARGHLKEQRRKEEARLEAWARRINYRGRHAHGPVPASRIVEWIEEEPGDPHWVRRSPDEPWMPWYRVAEVVDLVEEDARVWGRSEAESRGWMRPARYWGPSGQRELGTLEIADIIDSDIEGIHWIEASNGEWSPWHRVRDVEVLVRRGEGARNTAAAHAERHGWARTLSYRTPSKSSRCRAPEVVGMVLTAPADVHEVLLGSGRWGPWYEEPVVVDLMGEERARGPIEVAKGRERREAKMKAKLKALASVYLYRGNGGPREPQGADLVDWIESEPDGQHWIRSPAGAWVPWFQVDELANLVDAEVRDRGAREAEREGWARSLGYWDARGRCELSPAEIAAAVERDPGGVHWVSTSQHWWEPWYDVASITELVEEHVRQRGRDEAIRRNWARVFHFSTPDEFGHGSAAFFAERLLEEPNRDLLIKSGDGEEEPWYCVADVVLLVGDELAERARREAEWRANKEAEQKAKEEAERKAKEEAERKAKEEAERKAKEEAEQKAKEEAEQKAEEEAEQKAEEEAERKAKEEAEHKAQEEVEAKTSPWLRYGVATIVGLVGGLIVLGIVIVALVSYVKWQSRHPNSDEPVTSIAPEDGDRGPESENIAREDERPTSSESVVAEPSTPAHGAAAILGEGDGATPEEHEGVASSAPDEPDTNPRVVPTPSDGLTWIDIPGGRFEMGSTNGDSDERPVHTVEVRSFQLTRSEVTVAQYRACMDAGVCSDPSPRGWRDCNWEVSGRDDHPINCVSWHQAEKFAQWASENGNAGARLPSEAEWEYAARSGGKSWSYPWGNEEPSCSHVVTKLSEGGDGCEAKGTLPVCSKPEGNTEHGVCDMSGNVYEMLQDCWHDNYSSAPADGSSWECSSSYRVIRGGCSEYGDNLQVSNRDSAYVWDSYDIFGFRLARGVPAASQP